MLSENLIRGFIPQEPREKPCRKCGVVFLPGKHYYHSCPNCFDLKGYLAKLPNNQRSKYSHIWHRNVGRKKRAGGLTERGVREI